MDSGPHPPAAGAHGEDVPDWDVPIPYVRRTHEWYGALGYGNPYRYAHFVEVPFAPLRRPLARSRVALLTTAAPYRPDRGPQDARAPYNAAAKFYEPYSGDTGHDHDLRVSHVAVDRDHLGDDADCWFPLPALRRAAAAGRVGEVAPRFHGVPTNRSQRHTLEVDGPELLARVRADGADVAVLVPNCPVCHQTMALVARLLEAAGVSTVVMGAAKDIVELAGVPRFLFSDFPLGNAAGRPHDVASQDATLELALRVLESAPAPRTTVQNPLRWSGPRDWRLDYMNVSRLGPDEIARRRAENDRTRTIAQQVRDATLSGTP
jgi:D-proline reductase (dithiol) PrdB